MNIGTGKITKEEMQNIPHFGLDIIAPSDTFSVVDFQKSIHSSPLFQEYKKIFDKNNNLCNNNYDYCPYSSLIQPRKIVPIICGGTGLYIDSLIFERDYMGSKPDTTRRDELEKFRQEHGNEALWKKLYDIDPKYANILHPNNHTYIIRGIEIFEETGRSKLEAESPTPILKFPTIFLTPYEDTEENRQSLYEKINRRIDTMFADGLLEEVKTIAEKYGLDCPGLKTIGYKEIVSYMKCDISLEVAKNLIAQHNRNYAKRQITWNKKYEPYSKTLDRMTPSCEPHTDHSRHTR